MLINVVLAVPRTTFTFSPIHAAYHLYPSFFIEINSEYGGAKGLITAMSADADTQKTARTFHRILNQPKVNAGNKSRTEKDVEEGIKKIRRLILVEGIPHTIVSP